MKKISMILFVLAAVFAGVFAEGTEPAGIQPQMVQAAFYTPSYQCVYLKGSDELGLAYKPNSWNSYTIAVKKDTITYDGMSGTYKNVNVIRVKSNTEKSGKEVVIYLDNITVTDGAGKVVQKLDFEDGTNAGAYCTQGKPLADNATVVTKDGKKVFLLHMKSENLYGYNGVEVQWNMPTKADNWDLSAGDYSVSYDYYISVAK